ncbi:T9SS type A sorting domain-containing protein [Phaeodactylibacter luteus]|uniref:T9SS type A sorting domain-containing protein n=1 Tax=Phaeodactylibacter luteus TaxID=1564516 RepID=A0A5C6RPX5_9BACT|nr:T9SS type A sorting domain-containing protein [Phaeodactylibacter luteus]TXB63422.1 T9SS type A sorting domain-containing protein [Phaeodactylibacter luteus]
MKKVALFTLAFMALGSLQAQDCAPNENVPDSVVVSPLPYNEMERPEAGIADTACVGSYFEFAFTFNIPSVYDLNGVQVPLNAVQVPAENGINELPSSMDYVCNPPDCLFEADSSGCILIYGTPTAEDQGVHDLSILAQIQTAIGINLDIVLPENLEPNSHYYLNIREEGFDNCLLVSTWEAAPLGIQLSSRPNPFGTLAQIEMEVARTGDYQFFVADMLGQKVHARTVNLFSGLNQLEFDGSNLPEGLYIYGVTDGRSAVTSKMIINR